MGTLELLLIFAALPIFDWAARWQIENAFAFGLREHRRVPPTDYWRIGILISVAVVIVAIGVFGNAEPMGFLALLLVVAYFVRLALSARLTSPPDG